MKAERAPEQLSGAAATSLQKPEGFVSVLRVVTAVRPLLALVVGAVALGLAAGCTTVEPGQDFNIADAVFDENFFYCQVEPMLFAQRCGPGDPGKGDGNGSCHFNVTSFKLKDYSPLVGDSCGGSLVPGVSPPPAAKSNYQASQARMQVDPELAALLNRPTGRQAHPRVIFDPQSPEADLLRQWATKFSTQ